MDSQDFVTGEVRTHLRRRAIDPVADPDAAAAVVAEVVAAYEEQAASGHLPPLPDAARTRRDALDAVAGFGALQALLDDPTVEEIWLNRPDAVFVARGGRSELTTVILTEDEVRDLVERMLRRSGRRVDLSQPFVDASLPDGSRLHVVIPDVTRQHAAVNIRKFVSGIRSLDGLVESGSLTPPAARFLRAAMVAGLNVIVSGGTQAGKTTLVGCLLAAAPPRQRVVTCEEVFELQVSGPDWVAMQTRPPSLDGTGEITLRRLVKEALRMRPDRIVVGEVREAEALDLLLALNAGLPGTATVHANSAREALGKLTVLPLLAGGNVTAAFTVPTVASAVDLVVHTALRNGRRRVMEIVGVTGRVEDGVVETEEIFRRVDERLVRGDGYPPRAERFEAAGFDLATLLGPLGRAA